MFNMLGKIQPATSTNAFLKLERVSIIKREGKQILTHLYVSPNRKMVSENKYAFPDGVSPLDYLDIVWVIADGEAYPHSVHANYESVFNALRLFDFSSIASELATYREDDLDMMQEYMEAGNDL